MENKLRIGLLVDSDSLPNWAAEIVNQINKSDHSEVVLVVKKLSSPKPKQSFFKKLQTNFNSLLYLVYQRLETKIYTPNNNAFKQVLWKQLTDAYIINAKTRETRFSDYFDSETLKEIENHKIDIFIRFGFKILRGEILELARYGVWSYHHGDNRVNRGGPAGVWEVFKGWNETGVVLQILNEDLDGGVLLDRSISATDKSSSVRNKNNLYWRALNTLPRKLQELHSLGPELFFEQVKQFNSEPVFYSNRLFTRPNNWESLLGFGKIIFSKVRIFIYSKFFYDQWGLWYKFGEEGRISKTMYRFKEIVPPKDRFWADPFVVHRDDQHYVFFEEKLLRKGKGKISVLRLDENGEYSEPKTILERDYHLSYPFIFEDSEKLFMIPESGENLTVDLFECVEFPYEWSYKSTLLKDIVALDSTILFKDDIYWLFCNIKPNKGSSSHDELHLFYSESLDSDNWTPHPLNPIKSSSSYARPAGQFFYYNDLLIRPSQNCSERYGHSININSILKLSKTEYAEQSIGSIKPQWRSKLKATHTINSKGRLTIVDAQSRRVKWM